MFLDQISLVIIMLSQHPTPNPVTYKHNPLWFLISLQVSCVVWLFWAGSTAQASAVSWRISRELADLGWPQLVAWTCSHDRSRTSGKGIETCKRFSSLSLLVCGNPIGLSKTDEHGHVRFWCCWMEPHWSSQRLSSILRDAFKSLHLKNIHKESKDKNDSPRTAPSPLVPSPLPCHVGAAATDATSCVSWDKSPRLVPPYFSHLYVSTAVVRGSQACCEWINQKMHK